MLFAPNADRPNHSWPSHVIDHTANLATCLTSPYCLLSDCLCLCRPCHCHQLHPQGLRIIDHPTCQTWSVFSPFVPQHQPSAYYCLLPYAAQCCTRQYCNSPKSTTVVSRLKVNVIDYHLTHYGYGECGWRLMLPQRRNWYNLKTKWKSE